MVIIPLALLQQSHTCTGLIGHCWVLEGSAWLRAAPHPCRHQPSLWQDGLWPLGLCHCPANLVFSSWGPNLTLHLLFLRCCRAETPGLFPSLLFVQIFSPLARTRRRGYRFITPANSWPSDSRGFQPASPHRYFFRMMRPIWAPSIFPRRVYFPEKTKLLMSREIISLRPVLWSFGYTPYLVCCWEGVVSVFCIWHVDGNS